jgi:predicted phosphate transport protein (TIGR00153 family)
MSDLIMRWFGDKRNEEILGMVKKHLELTKAAVSELYNMVFSASDNPLDKAGYYKKVSEFEMQADNLRRDMIQRLTEKEAFPTEREDLMELVRAVDWVADWSREASRILAIIPYEKVTKELKEACQAMSKADISAVTLLEECVDELQKDARKALERANQVELMEEEIDELYQQARIFFISDELTGFNTGSMILLNEFMDAMETIADWCENTADIIRAIAIRILK